MEPRFNYTVRLDRKDNEDSGWCDRSPAVERAHKLHEKNREVYVIDERTGSVVLHLLPKTDTK